MSWFTESTNTSNVETVVQESTPFYVESGEYKAKILFAGIYASTDSQSKGLYVSFGLENGTTIDQYINYQGKDGKCTREIETSEGKKTVKSIGLDTIEAWSKIIEFGKPSVEVIKKMWGKDKKITIFEKAGGAKVGVLVRHVQEPDQNGVMRDKNEIESIFDLDSRKTANELYFKEDDTRNFTINKWIEKIEKNPTLVRKPRGEKKQSVSDSAKAKEVEDSGW